MSDSNCNCCGCQYSTPPWWVTMGFIPPNNSGGYYSYPTGGGQPGFSPPPSGGTTVPPPPRSTTVPPPQTPNPEDSREDLLEKLQELQVRLAGGGRPLSPVGAPLVLAKGVVNEVVGEIGKILSKIF